MIELDVHVHRGRVEVRHEKVLWPTSRLWERWFLLPRGASGVAIEDVLDALGPEPPLMLDLKCFTPWAARRIRAAAGETRSLTVSTRSWWILRAFSDRPATVLLRSCNAPWQLSLAKRLPGLSDRAGIVVHQRLLDPAEVGDIRSLTSLLFTWAVRSVDRAKVLTDAGVTGLIVDDLDLDWPGKPQPD
jgi:glycerophosphoryl diester phosphodiesterase